MAFISGYEFIVKNKSGIIFNFYLNEQRSIEYIASNSKGIWNEKYMVLSEATESFHVEIDENDHIHIISFHSNGGLYYSHFNKDQWQNHLITQYAEDQKILYPSLKFIHNEIHIFYYLLNLSEKNKAFLLHLNFNRKDYKTNHVATVSSHSYINSFKVFHREDTLFLLYGSVIHNFDQIYLSKLNLSTMAWEEPRCLTDSKDKKIYINGLLYNENLHILWSSYNEEHLIVHYLNLNTDALNTPMNDLRPVSLSTESSCSFPTLCYYQGILWTFWVEMNKVVSCHSVNLGETWSNPWVHEDTRNFDFKRYKYLSNSNNNENDILCDFLFGSSYPNIQFLGFGGETNDDIPTGE